MSANTTSILICALALLLGGCAEVQVQPSNMAIEYQFLDDPDEIYEACGQRAEACARVVGNSCVITLPKVHWDQHLVHEMRHCFGEQHAPTVAVNNW